MVTVSSWLPPPSCGSFARCGTARIAVVRAGQQGRRRQGRAGRWWVPSWAAPGWGLLLLPAVARPVSRLALQAEDGTWHLGNLRWLASCVYLK